MIHLLLIMLALGPMGAQAENLPKTTENTENMLIKYTAYNLWANEQIANWLMEASEEVFDQEIESSFNTIRKTLIHIWNAEYGWLNSVKDEAWGSSPGQDFNGSGKDLLEGLLEASRNFHAHVAAMSDAQLNATKTNSRGTAMTYADMIQHCMNHSTYHRGQLITMGRQAGLSTPPRTDFIYYISLP